MESLISEIFEDLKAELNLTDESDLAILSSKIKNAYREIRHERNYQKHHDEDFITFDMQNYYSNIRELALYDYNQFGAEGQTSHSENGTSRTWKDRKECLRGVIPFAKIL